MPLGRWGLLSIGSAQVSFNYSVPTGFQIRNEIDMTLWLIEPPPSLDALIAAVDAVKQPVKQPAKPMKKVA